MGADGMDAKFTLTYSYSRPQLRRYFWREFRRTQSGLAIGLVLALAVAAWAARYADLGWYSGFIVGFSIAYGMLLFASFRRLGQFPVDRPMTTTIGESGMRFASAIIVSELPWSSLLSARESQDGLTLRARYRSAPVLLPADVLTPEIVAYIRDKITLHRGGAARP